LGLIPEDLSLTAVYTCDEETGSATSRPILTAESEGASLAFVFEPAGSRGGYVVHRRGVVSGSLEAIGVRPPLGPVTDAELALSRMTASLESHNDASRGVVFQIFPPESRRRPDSAGAAFILTYRDDEALSHILRTFEKIVSSSWAPECRTGGRIAFSVPSPIKKENDAAAAGMIEGAGRRLGLTMSEEPRAGASDGLWCAFRGLTAIDGLGPHMSEIHTRLESLSLKSIQERTELFALSIALSKDEFFARSRG
jgi:glutamate carboxypeptidase